MSLGRAIAAKNEDFMPFLFGRVIHGDHGVYALHAIGEGYEVLEKLSIRIQLVEDLRDFRRLSG